MKFSGNHNSIFIFALIFLGISVFSNLYAQKVTINPTGAPPNPSAILDVYSANKGLLMPRVALTSAIDVSTITSPATSLLIYNTASAGSDPNAVTPGYYYWNGTKWTSLIGPAGSPGAAGMNGVSDFAHFFALMPPDNAATIASGTDVDFPQDGPSSGSGLITRTSANAFNLAQIGVYMITFQVSITEAGQLILTLNGADLSYTVVGRQTGTSQITNTCLVQTTSINSILTVRNPVGNFPALTISPLAGGTRPVSASLTILQL